MQLERYAVVIPRNPFAFFLPLSALLLILVQSGCAGYTSTDAAPSIVTQPTNQTVTAGQTAIFSVSASGTAPLSYHWNKNGMAISGATFPSYTTPPETTSGSGARFTVTVSNSAGKTISNAATLTVSASPSGVPLQIDTSSLPSAEVGIQFQTGLSATGGVEPYRWSVVSGPLPLALSLNPNTGALSGTASQNGQFDFGVQVSDSSSPNPQTAMKALLLSVVLALQIVPGGLPNGQVGVPYQASLSGSGGVPPYAWYIVGTPPSGLSLNTESVVIAGTPTEAGTSTFTVALEDSAGHTTQKSSSVTIAAAEASGGTVITPAVPPAVNQGSTFQFKANATGTWSCSGTDSSGAATACKGSIDPSTGLYTAPAKVTAQQSLNGCEVLPNNHILNTNISALPVNSSSATWISAAGSVGILPVQATPLNYVYNSTPTVPMRFAYTPAQNASWEMPSYPLGNIESGWLSTWNALDHHVYTTNPTTCIFQEAYGFYTAGTNSAYPPSTSWGGVQYAGSTYTLASVPGSNTGAADACGMNQQAMNLHLQEMLTAVANTSMVNHALRTTLPLSTLSNTFLWPATSKDFSGAGVVPCGARFRLKSTFNISGYPAIEQVILKTLQNYGMIVDDGGTTFNIAVDYTKWPVAYVNAFKALYSAGIGASNFDVVDESSLEQSTSSGDTTANRETVTFTRTSDGATASVDVVLTGVTIGLLNDAITMQAGSASLQLIAYVNGSSNSNVTWSMSPTVGTLTSGGIYAPPSAESSETVTTITATATADTNVTASFPMTILPNGTMYILMNTQSIFSSIGWTWPFVDGNGNTWQSQTGDNGGMENSNNYNNPPWASLATAQQYAWSYQTPSPGDEVFTFYVPNGTYNVDGPIR